VGELTDQLRSFLPERRYAVLATHDPDGGIRLTPIWCLFEDDRFYFASSSRSRKVRNLERSFSASVVVDAREPGRERWVAATPVRSTPLTGSDTSTGAVPRPRRWAVSGAARPTPSTSVQKLQYGPGASSSVLNGAPTGAIATATSCAGTLVSLRPMCPFPVSTYPCPAVTTCGEQVGSSRS
jgi:Pyridoxamine 5'-phosphate oxidase